MPLEPAAPLCFSDRCRAHSLGDCSWLQAGSAPLLSCSQGQLSHDAPVMGGASSVQSLDINKSSDGSPQPGISAWTLVVTVSSCCRATNPVQPRSGPHHYLRWHRSLFILDCSSSLPGLQFCLAVPRSFGFSFSSISPSPPCSSQWSLGYLSVWAHLRSILRSAMAYCAWHKAGWGLPTPPTNPCTPASGSS